MIYFVYAIIKQLSCKKYDLCSFFWTNEFKRQCVYNACNCLLNGTFLLRLSCYSNQSMISIGVFSGDHVKDTRSQKNRRHQFSTFFLSIFRGVATLGSNRHVPKHKFDNIFLYKAILQFPTGIDM